MAGAPAMSGLSGLSGRRGPSARHRWERDEDAALLRLVGGESCVSAEAVDAHIKGTKWAVVSAGISGILGKPISRKQARERYTFHLAPFINRSTWTREEFAQAVALRDAGEKIGDITARLPSAPDGSRRTSLDVKNTLNSTKRRRVRADVRGVALDPPPSRAKCPW